MRRIVAIFNIMLLCMSALVANAQGSGQYRLMWKDDFNGNALNGAYWEKLYRTAPYSWGMYMSKSDSVYECRRGVLRLYAMRNDGIEPNDTARYLCGGITTRHKKSITYGKIEVRLKMVGARGTWPAVWTMPVAHKDWAYPRRAEIDILEYLHKNDFVYQTVHTFYTDSLRQTANPMRQAKSPIRFEKYNTYAVEILPTELIFSINGKETMRYPKIEGAEDGQFPFGVESYLMIDMQLSSHWTGAIVGDDQLPAYIEIDWVKFYELENAATDKR